MEKLKPSFRTVAIIFDCFRLDCSHFCPFGYNVYICNRPVANVLYRLRARVNDHSFLFVVKYYVFEFRLSLCIILFCSSSDIPECDFITSIILSSEESENAVAIFDCALYTNRPNDVRIISPCFRLITPIFNSLEVLV